MFFFLIANLPSVSVHDQLVKRQNIRPLYCYVILNISAFI